INIVLAKLIITALCGAIVFALAPLLLYIAHAAFGWPATASAMTTVYAVALKYLLITWGYSALAGIAVYGFQRTTFAMVAYILFAFNIVGGLFTVFLVNMVGADFAAIFTSRLMSGITDRILNAIIGGGSLTLPLIEYIIYVAIAVTVSSIAFNKKEMEF
ncbi:MAG: hypothetical protein FWF04_03125, partial [Clostridiales bacterium]|nr:hypothetical protein [Clostridiales bacterium]